MSTNAVLYDELVGQVRQAWADVLGNDSAESVPLDVNFLEIGGNSMLLVMLWEQLRPLAARQLRLSELFQHGTVRAQAELLSQAGETQAGAAQVAPAARTASGGRSLLAQRRSAGAGGVD